mmetsp:Transcript_14425/g.24612  ORF Transcript_14425/g.24612 Transcript_14425/m.24612 type:complete len:114 (+) Transcript_14425:1006-1347(+)
MITNLVKYNELVPKNIDHQVVLLQKVINQFIRSVKRLNYEDSRNTEKIMECMLNVKEFEKKLKFLNLDQVYHLATETFYERCNDAMQLMSMSMTPDQLLSNLEVLQDLPLIKK